jgi:Family of unknown function (DUF6232)
MRVSSKTINLGVSQGVLWIGAEAYPLHNIARVQNVELVPRRGRAVGSFVKQVLLWAVLGGGGIAGLRFADLSSSDVEKYTEYIAIGVGALVVVSLLVLLVALARRTYHALVIETSGTPHAAVVSPDEGMVTGLVQQIMRAISNPRDPRTEFHTTIVTYKQGDHFHGGQTFNQYGANSVGVQNR